VYQTPLYDSLWPFPEIGEIGLKRVILTGFIILQVNDLAPTETAVSPSQQPPQVLMSCDSCYLHHVQSLFE
jgi:hypothetical protein